MNSNFISLYLQIGAHKITTKEGLGFDELSNNKHHEDYDNDMKVQDAMKRMLKEFVLGLKFQLILLIKDQFNLVVLFMSRLLI